MLSIVRLSQILFSLLRLLQLKLILTPWILAPTNRMSRPLKTTYRGLLGYRNCYQWLDTHVLPLPLAPYLASSIAWASAD